MIKLLSSSEIYDRPNCSGIFYWGSSMSVQFIFLPLLTSSRKNLWCIFSFWCFGFVATSADLMCYLHNLVILLLNFCLYKLVLPKFASCGWLWNVCHEYNFEFQKVKLDIKCIYVLWSVAIQLEYFFFFCLWQQNLCWQESIKVWLVLTNISFNERNYITEK